MLVYGLHDGEPPDLVEDFVEQTGVSFPVIPGEATRAEFAFPIGNGYPYPRDVVVDKDLRVRAIRNSFDAAEMSGLVATLLSE